MTQVRSDIPTGNGTIELPRGAWQPIEPASGRVGYVILDGVILRRMNVGRLAAGELLGQGDLVRPWHAGNELPGAAESKSGWDVLRPARLTPIGANSTASSPRLAGALLDRAARRNGSLVVQLAACSLTRIEDRLHVALWHFADRWGHKRGDSAVLDLPLSHAQLALLVCARRPTVTTALSALRRAGMVERAEGIGWMLHEPPAAALAID